MTKKHFIALADAIREHDRICDYSVGNRFLDDQINTLADFCRKQNSDFMADRWLDYIAGRCGKNGGKIK